METDRTDFIQGLSYSYLVSLNVGAEAYCCFVCCLIEHRAEYNTEPSTHHNTFAPDYKPNMCCNSELSN